MRTRRNVLKTAVGTAAVGLSSGCLGTLSGSDQTVSFGAVYPLSGPLEQVGTHGKRATEQAVRDINAAGGINGQRVELTAIDSEATVETAVEGYREFAESGGIGFVGGLVSDVSIALSQEVADDEIMEVSPASTAPQLTTAGRVDDRKFFGRTVPSDGLQAAAMAKVVDDSLYIGADSVALLSIDNSFGAGLAEAQRSLLDAEIVADVRYDSAADSFDGTLDTVFENDPDAVAFTSVSGQEGGILDAYSQRDEDVPWVFSAGMFGGDVPSYYDGFYSASLSSSRADGYFDLVRRLSDIDALEAFAANGYDAMFLMAAAAQQAGETTGPAIADTIRSVSGGTGHTVSVGDFDKVRSLTDAGRELNYQGASGGVDLTENLEPLSSYLIQRIDGGVAESLELLQRGFFESEGER
ncbi:MULTISPECIES: ABC transporter substrate-binding protein [Halomicrobium]|uniref:Extracellular ligand-binding receptor n=1 Tax=Halomicrobium mukohataei (strain ATCC 700874 / DSM 12286 / JCM 9738 / NCIMB 13541) TaxID=485914 RepID=C7NY73_HALMD|nr:ABC transporter substrate-binding protein [Halomicrobium mukohataei]ACV48533.1 Extracellular ligand-binding receptor [Halomicrobium mukohataei DSM 12286]